MDFCLKVGTEIETLFRELLNDKKFDSEPDIKKSRADQNINVYITLQIFTKADTLPDCTAFNSLIGNFTGTFHDFNVTAVVNFIENVDYFEIYYFLIDISLQAEYFWDLIDVSIFLDDLGLLG